MNGLVPGLFPHEDEVAAIRAVPERGTRENSRSPAGRVGRPRELGWAATFLCSPFAAYVTGHTMVVDGANWQRRALRQPDFTAQVVADVTDPAEKDKTLRELFDLMRRAGFR